MNATARAFKNPTVRIAGVLVFVGVVAYFIAPRLASVGGFGAVLDRANIVGIVALGLTVCLIAGQIDLSIGANIALSGVVAMASQPLFGTVGGLIAGVGVGLLIGVINAAIVVWLGVPSLIATLATMLVVRSAALVISDGQPITGGDIQLALTIDRFVLPGVTVRTVVWLAAAVLLGVILLITRVGRNLFAVGGDPVAARSAGIPSRRYIAATIIVSGGFGGLAGVLLAATLNTGSPVVGDSTLLTALAAAVIGGATLTGGKGSAIGAVFGVLTVVLAVVAMEFSGIPSYIQQIVSGTILVAVLLIDRLTSRRP
jgi:ribose transport system permease protein